MIEKVIDTISSDNPIWQRSVMNISDPGSVYDCVNLAIVMLDSKATVVATAVPPGGQLLHGFVITWYVPGWYRY